MPNGLACIRCRTLRKVATDLEGNEKLEAALEQCWNAVAHVEQSHFLLVAAIMSLDEYVRQITGDGHDDDCSSNSVQNGPANDHEAFHRHQATRYGLAPS
jgi:hypothetical protein